MFGRIFGRGKDDQDQAVCAQCGRTLLAGEWTQTVVDEHGDERLICSLCGQAYAGENEPVAAAPAPANNGRMRETRSEARNEEQPEPAPVAEPPARDTHAESDAFWQALKDKDAQIEGLKAELARAEAERQELAGRFARLGSRRSRWSRSPARSRETRPSRASAPGARRRPSSPPRWRRCARPRPLPPSSRPSGRRRRRRRSPTLRRPPRRRGRRGRRRRGRRRAGADAADAAAAVASSPPPKRTLRRPKRLRPCRRRCSRTRSPSTSSPTRMLAAAKRKRTRAPARSPRPTQRLPWPPAAERCPASRRPKSPPCRRAAEAEAAAASLTLLQRGVDLLNVSRVPRKIAETNEELGLPHVHVGFDGQTVAATFMWTMGWYRFHVDLDSGDVGMDDRGYEELALQPNAGVRADGTVQLAPAQISRAAAQRAQAAPETAAPDGPVAGRRARRSSRRARDPARGGAEAAGVPQQVPARPAQRRRERVLGPDPGARLRLGPLSA